MRRLLLAVTIGFVALTLFDGAAEAQRRRRGIRVNIESVPAGATVYLDSPQSPPLGTTPLNRIRVERGNHTLIFRLDNHEEGRLPVRVRRRRETFRVVLNALSTLVVTPGNSAANNAAVRIDGQPVGNIPFRQTLQPGRHLVQVGREGHVTYTQWVELSGAQVFTLPVLLEREAPETGALLVGGDVSGAAVLLDGVPRGSTPTLIENVPAGEHQLEIRPQGMDIHRETVRVIAGERISVNPTMRPAPARTGSVRVIANVPGAIISLDGETLGAAPASRDSVTPGEHILEATADGYQTAQLPVTVEPGQQRVVSIRLERDPRQAGGIVVDASVGGAIVTVDGEERGPAPIVIDTPTSGRHAIVVRAEGYEDFRTTCETGPGRDCEITARMQPVGTPVRVVANTRGALLFVDGNALGPIPYEGNLPVGQHRIEVRAPRYHTYVEQVQLVASSTPREFNVALTREGDMSQQQRAAAAREARRLRTGATSHAAAPLPLDLAVLDLSIGWPYVAELRLNVGILPWLEAGFATRTFGRLTEFEGRVKLGVRPLRQLSVAVQARFGGGIGPTRELTADEQAVPMVDMDLRHGVNSFFMLVEALGTLHFSDQGAFTLWLAGDLTTDQYDFDGRDSNALLVTETSLSITGTSRSGRENLARVRLGGALDLVVNRRWNVWFLFEGILLGTDRDVLGDIFNFGTEDTQLYVRLGITHKF